MEVNGKEIIIVADRILVTPDKGESTTRTGLVLPPNAVDAKAVQAGRIVEVGPGIPVIHPGDRAQESWKETSEESHYVPLQARNGDLALYLADGHRLQLLAA